MAPVAASRERSRPSPGPNCGSTQFNPGYIDDATGNASVRWFEGPIEYGLLGGIKRSGRQSRVVTGCSRLELYAGEVT